MSLNFVDVSTLTVAGTSIGLDSASPTKATAFAAGARQALIVVEGAPVYVRSDGDAATSADMLLNVGDALPILGDSMNQALDNLRFIRKTSTSATLKITWYNREAVLTERIIRGSVRFVTENGDSVTDDTADAVKTLSVDAAGAELAKAEDSAHVSGDKGIMLLGVRRDAGTALAGADGDYIPATTDQHGGLRIGRPIFGKTTLAAANNGEGKWVRGETSPLDQKSPTGWLANLYGGIQTGDDWTRVNIPADELLLTKFTGTSQWTYWMTNAETMGVNIVLWVHDPTDFSKRAEITQLANVAGLAKAQGWNKHILNSATTQFFWYGENVTGSGLTAGTQYTLAQFIADVVFSTYTIYRITIEYGWEASGTFEDAFVADLMLNGIAIPLEPSAEELSLMSQLRSVSVTKALVAAAAYDIADVMSEDADAGQGTAWTFARIAHSDGGKGYIVKAHIISETTAVTPSLILYLFTATPTCELDDNAANTALLHADIGNYVGKIDFPAMAEIGTGDAESLATPSTNGNLPLAFQCAPSSDDLIGVLVTNSAVTLDAGDDMTIVLTTQRA